MEKLSESHKRKDSNEEARPKKSRKSVTLWATYKRSQSMKLVKERGNRTEKQEEERIAHLSEQQLKMQQDTLQMVQQQHQNQQDNSKNSRETRRGLSNNFKPYSPF